MILPPQLITLVLPFYNEEAFLEATVRSLLAQDRQDFALILVDNGSSDSSPAIAAALAEAAPGRIALLREAQPGKIHALRRGLAEATSDLVGTLDADTIYPPEFVSRTLGLFDAHPRAACVIAHGLEGRGDQSRKLGKLRLFSGLFPGKAHSGGCGQAFRRSALDAAGGFDPQRWPYVLEDHEIIHRVTAHGTIAYGFDHVCYPAPRRQGRFSVSWNLIERVLYKLLPRAAMDWYFYRFLARRLERRGLMNVKLREQNWSSGGQAPPSAAS